MNRLAWAVVAICGAICGAIGISPALAEEWTRHEIVTANTGISSAVAHDFNGDGLLDVLTSYEHGIWLHRGPRWKRSFVAEITSQRSKQTPRPSCIHSCLLDCDLDGDLDFVGANRTLFWLENPGTCSATRTRWAYHMIDDGITDTHCTLAGDVDGDGRDDLIANSFLGPGRTEAPYSICLFYPPVFNDGLWVRHNFTDRNAPGGSHYMGLGDVNGDGKPDIACAAKGTDGFANGRWFAWWEQPTEPGGDWTKHVLAEDQLGATNIHPGDFTGDGIADFFATRGHGTGVLLFRGPDFAIEEIDPEIEGPHSLVTTDLDGDGDLDAATCGRATDGIAVWYENDGTGRFDRHVIARDQGCYDLRAADIDADGNPDLLIAGQGSRNVVWLENPLKEKPKVVP